MVEQTDLAQRARDFPNQFAIGVNSSVKALSDFFGADNPVSQNLNKNIDWYRQLLSAQAQKNEQELSRILQDAEGKGILEELGAGVSAFSVAPADFVATGLGSVATFAATGIAGRAVGLLKSTQTAAGMGIGAGAVKGQIYETVKEEMILTGKSKEEAQKIAMEAQATLGKNLPSILIGSGLGAVNARTGAELIISKVLTKGGLEASASRVGNIVANGFMEGAPELAQSAHEKFSSNLALRQAGFDIPLTRGIYADASLGGLSGMSLGALAGGVEPRVGGRQTLETLETPASKDSKDSKKLSIYLDLDETLVHAKNVSGNLGVLQERVRITLTEPKGEREEHYDTLLRPHAQQMLEFCRGIGDVKLLTTANRQYALKHNDAFNLGFNPDQIIAREDYILRTRLAYGSVYDTLKDNSDPSAFLIDNLPPSDDSPKLKIKFLGIKEDQYIQIREFSGKDPDFFAQELKEIFNKLENHRVGLEMTNQPKETPRALMPEQEGGINFTNRLGFKLHEIWVEDYKKGNADKKFKPVDDPDFANLEIVGFRGSRIPKQDVLPSAKLTEALDQINEIRTKNGDRIDTTGKKLYDCRILKKEGSEGVGYIVQNIAQEPELINPALMERLNGKIAGKYLDTIGPDVMEMSKEDFAKCREDISSLVHDVWVEENKAWAPKEQQVSYKDLPEFEKEKDRRVADALMGTIQEIKTIGKLKEIEIESTFEPLSKPSKENVKKASEWIKEINLCGKELSKSPWFLEASKTLRTIKESMSGEVYNVAYKEFEKSLTGEMGGSLRVPQEAKVKAKPVVRAKGKALDYEEGMVR